MARVQPVFMAKGNGGFADGIQTNVSHLIEGGNFGYAKQWHSWVNNHQYTSRPLLTFLLEPPIGFKLLPNKEDHIGALRSLVETVRHRWTGLQHKLTVNVESSQSFGGSGQKYEVFTNVTEEQSSVSLSVWERPGLAIGRFFKFWINMLMMNPETKYASISTVAGAEAEKYDSMPDMYAMSMLFIEPDTNHRHVVQSWIGINMWPKDSGDNEAKHDKDNPSEVRELTIGFTGIFQYGPGVDYFAQKYLDNINLIGANEFHQKAAIQGIDAMVASARTSYVDTVRAVSRAQYK